MMTVSFTTKSGITTQIPKNADHIYAISPVLLLSLSLLLVEYVLSRDLENFATFPLKLDMAL